MKKTWIPNSIILFSIIYVTIISWGILFTENKAGILFYALVLALFFTWIIYYRDPLACLLKIEDYQLKTSYIFPNVKDMAFDLHRIQSNIILRRYYHNTFAGGFPGWPEYLNYKWYFSPERYELEFMYNNECVVISFQPNLIGFEKFLKVLVQDINALNNYKIQPIKSDFGKQDLITEMSLLAIKLIIP